MRRYALTLLLASTILAQQPRSRADLLSLTDQLQAAVKSGDWRKAAELSDQLRTAAADQRNRSLSSDAIEQINTILKWLPEDTETVAVAQEAFTLSGTDADNQNDALTVARGYVLNPLYGAAESRWEKSLQGRTLRFAAIAARKFANHQPEKGDILPLGMIAYEGMWCLCICSTICRVDSTAAPDLVPRPPDLGNEGRGPNSQRRNLSNCAPKAGHDHCLQ